MRVVSLAEADCCGGHAGSIVKPCAKGNVTPSNVVLTYPNRIDRDSLPRVRANGRVLATGASLRTARACAWRMGRASRSSAARAEPVVPGPGDDAADEKLAASGSVYGQSGRGSGASGSSRRRAGVMAISCRGGLRRAGRSRRKPVLRRSERLTIVEVNSSSSTGGRFDRAFSDRIGEGRA